MGDDNGVTHDQCIDIHKGLDEKDYWPGKRLMWVVGAVVAALITIGTLGIRTGVSLSATIDQQKEERTVRRDWEKRIERKIDRLLMTQPDHGDRRHARED